MRMNGCVGRSSLICISPFGEKRPPPLVCMFLERWIDAIFLYATRVEIRNKDARRVSFLWCRGGIGRRRREMETGN